MKSNWRNELSLFQDGGRYHIEISPLICSANQWTGFYMITASFMKELINFGSCWKLLSEKVWYNLVEVIVFCALPANWVI